MAVRRFGLLVPAVAVLALAAACTTSESGTGRPGASPTPSSTGTAAGRGDGASPVSVYPISLPEGGTIMIFGDSWTVGWSATPHADGFAHLLGPMLGMTSDVQGVAGTGYVNPGPDKQSTYAQRLAQLPDSDPAVVVVQGSTNDAGAPAARVTAACETTLRLFQQRFPHSGLVMMGTGTTNPTSDKFPQLDQAERAAAAAVGVDYISPIAEGWFTTANAATMLTATVTHPTNAGHQLLAARLAADLRALAR